MEVLFDKEYLRQLYERGKCDDKKHRYQPQVVKKYVKVFAHRILCRLHRSNIETTAYIKELYKSGKGHNVKCVSYTYCIDGEWYNGHTSPPDSIWDNIQIGAPFEIVYEKGNHSNSNWVEYYKK